MYTHSANESTRLAVWHITEPESFFTRTVVAGKTIAHPHKRLQHLCGRYLLQFLEPHFPLASVVVEQDNKPFLPDHPYHFSISHSDDYAAAIVSTSSQVGIDVELVSARVHKVKHKFLTKDEEEMLAINCKELSATQQLTLAWSAKETLFKWLGETGVDFKAQLMLEQVEGSERDGLIIAKIARKFLRQTTLHFRFLNDIVLTWLN